MYENLYESTGLYLVKNLYAHMHIYIYSGGAL